nr:EAL domain-containing protein [Maliibacterium massiliense]
MKLHEDVKRRTLGLGLSLLLILAVALTLCVLLVQQSNRIIREETQRSLSEISEQSSIKINQRVSFNKTMISGISSNLALLKDAPAYREAYVQGAVAQSPFSWVGMVDTSGVLRVPGRGEMDVSQYPVVSEALAGETGVSGFLVPNFDGTMGVLYAAPYKPDGDITGAVAGWVSPDVMQDLLSTSTFDGAGFSHIINQQGDYIVQAGSAVASDEGFFTEMQQQAQMFEGSSIEKMRADMQGGKSGQLQFRLGEDMQEALTYIPLENNRWYLLSVVPTTVYADKVTSFTNLTLLLAAVVFFMFLCLIGAILLINRKNNRRITKMAYEDPVTGGFTSQRFEMAIHARMKDPAPFAFVSLDIRKFKLINDAFGSTRGNLVLKHVHDVIAQHLQDGESVARISSDTFNVLLNSTEQREIAQRLEDITRQINAFNERMDPPYYLTLDCGIFMVDRPQVDIVMMRDRSNAARKSNKQRNNAQHCACVFYNDLDRVQLLREKEMENIMERALENDEFVVYLQPKVSIETGKTVGAEALVCWNNPERGIIYPNDFIPLFERNGFILQLDMYVFEQVCKLLRRWIDEGRKVLPISVNLSRNHLRIPHFLDKYQQIQQRYGVPPAYIEIELTETLVFENLDQLKEVIDQIHAMGFQCSMDDFGSGYSSLNVLKEVPVDVLKLDRGFFTKEGDARGNDVVEAVVGLARKLGMQTVSEGVETNAQVEFLRQVRCDMIQGYVFSRAVPIEAFETMVFVKGM